METIVKELKSVKLRNPIMIAGFPGLGYIGKITVGYMVKQLRAEKMAELYSPYFPHHVITNSHGSARLPRAEFYMWKNPSDKTDLIFLSSDSQAQTVEGQYEVVSSFIDYAKELGVGTIVTIGGYSSNVDEGYPKVVCVSTSKNLLDEILKAGANISPPGNPIVGLAGLTLGLSKFRGIDAICILGETLGHIPDPAVSKNVLTVVQSFIGVSFDLEPLDKEIEKMVQTLKKMEDVQHRMDDFMKKSSELESRKLNYIT